MKKRGLIGLFSLMVLVCPYAYSQNMLDAYKRYEQQATRDFERAKSNIEQAFASYRDKINSEYVSYIEREWSKLSLDQGAPCPSKPEPQPILDETPAKTAIPLPFEGLTVLSEPELQPSPIEPIEVNSQIPNEILPDLDIIAIPEGDIAIRPDGSEKQVVYRSDNNDFVPFIYLGTSCKVRAPKIKSFSIVNGTNEEISKAWTALSVENFNDMLVDCLCIRKSLFLCDWAFYQLTQNFTKAYWGSETSNEAILTQTYIMTQLGYKMRLARRGRTLYGFLNFDQELYTTPFVSLPEGDFYCFDRTIKEGEFQICNFTFPGERALSSRISKLPKVSVENSATKIVCSDSFPNARAEVSTNKNLISFYNSYPSCSWEIQAAASLSQEVKDQLYPSLKQAIAGVSETEAADILLNFVQTGFEYKTDDEQFGREKSFFGDELFFYPYCDCEDRSILFSILVRDLLHLDVVLLEYPTHIATAVNFSSEVTGDFFDIDGKKYIVCDPTFIGAPIGKSMQQMKENKANILIIQ